MDTGAPRHLVPSFGPYLSVPDRDAVASAQSGDRRAAECLLYRYRNLVGTVVRSYFVPGAEREDLLQIGMIGLWQAIVDFSGDRSPSFPAFARMCIRRHLITAIKSASRQKRLPLNCSTSLEDALCVPDEALGREPAGDASYLDPESLFLSQDYVSRVRRALRTALSDFEWRVLADFQNGLTYHEIASHNGCKVKSVDNALARIRRKVAASRSIGGGPRQTRRRTSTWH